MNILHVIPSFSPEWGGPAHAVLGMVSGAQRGGHTATIAYVRTSGAVALPREWTESMSNVSAIGFAPSFPKRFRASRDMVRWLRQSARQYDVVHIHGVFTAGSFSAGAVCRTLRVPYIVRPHGSLDPYDLRKKAFLKKLIGPLITRRFLQGAVAVHCTSRREAERLETYGVKANVVIVPLPVLDATRIKRDPSASRPGVANGSSFRRSLGGRPNQFVVLFLSRLDKKKNIEIAIDAVRRLANCYPQIHLAICGNGDPEYEAELRAYAKDVTEAGFATFCGFVSGTAKAEALLESDAFLLPSSNENYGVAVVEALHAGTPVVCSDQVFIGEEIAEAKAGLICPATTDAVQKALAHLIDDHVSGGRLLEAMGRHGRELAQRRFSEESCTSRLLEMYEAAVR